MTKEPDKAIRALDRAFNITILVASILGTAIVSSLIVATCGNQETCEARCRADGRHPDYTDRCYCLDDEGRIYRPKPDKP